MSGHSSTSHRQSRSLHLVLLTSGSLVIVLTAYMVGKFLHGDFKDAEVWYDAGRRVLSGDTLVDLPHYRYPPTFAILIAPFCALGFGPFYFIWYVLNLWLFGLSGKVARAICFPGPERAPPRYHWLPLLLVAAFGIDNLILGQTNILIMVLVYWTFLEDSRGRQWLSGLPLGAAIAIKAFPAPLLVYFLCRGRVRVVAAALLSCAFFLFVFPAPVRGFGRNFREVHAWARRVPLPYISRGEAGDWGQHSLDFGNQSLSAIAHRYLTRADAQVSARGGRPMYVNVANLAAVQVNAVVLAAFGVLFTGFAAACGLRPPRDRRQWAVEYALVTVLLLLVSALSWTYFFVMLLLPVTVGVRLLDRRQSLPAASLLALRASLWGLALATVLLANHYARALGNLFWASLLLFTALAMACRDLRRAPLSHYVSPSLDAALRRQGDN